MNIYHIMPFYTIEKLFDHLGFVCRGSAFPATNIAREDNCLWDKKKRLAICGDFCISPNVEGAIISGTAAASKLTEILSFL